MTARTNGRRSAGVEPVASALRGKRGQAVLREALAALDALPVSELVSGDLEAASGVCLLGAVGKSRKLDMTGVDVEDHEHVASLFNLPHALACEIMWENDERGHYLETSRARWERMRRWVVSNIKGDIPSSPTPPSGTPINDGVGS